MAPKSKSTSKNERQRVQRSNSDSARWIVGLLLLFVGLYAALSVLFSYFTWAPDQSGLLLTSEERTTLGIEPQNLCGWGGAWIGKMLVDNSFGVFGILVPVMLILIGVRIIRKRQLLVNHSILTLFFILILGSLTLGFAFGPKWSLCASSGWGGAFGIAIGAMLRTHIGVFGTIILLLSGWILTGVFINRNFINRVNRAGNVMVDKSSWLADIFKRKVARAVGQTESEEDAGESETETETEPAKTAASNDAPEANRAPERVQTINDLAREQSGGSEPMAELRQPKYGITVERPTPETAPNFQPEADTPQSVDPEPIYEPSFQQNTTFSPEEENPFVELTPDGKPIGQPEENAAQSAPREVDDGEFTEVDLSRRSDRLVQGPGGLIELERSAKRDRQTTPPVQNGPFVELNTDGTPVVNTTAGDRRLGETHSAPTFTQDLGAAKSGPFTEISMTPTEGVVVTVEANKAREVAARSITTESYDPMKDLVNYRKPPVTLLENYDSNPDVSDEEIFENKTKIEETLKNFGIGIQRIKATVGPTVTLYEIVQEQGIKISKIQGLENDIAQSLKALGIRIIAPIPGKGTIGIEVPNRDKRIVSMYSAIRSQRFQESKAELPVVIGRTIQNENYVFDLAKMPHLLVAGATGQGKSVGLNAIITSLLYRKHPAQLKFVMIDPKMVEFSLYSKIEKHFLAKMESEEEAIITDPKKAVYTLNALCTEMDARLELCKNAGARNIAEYNEKFIARRLNPQKGHRFLPYIVVVVDEFADLIMTAREVEGPVMRLAQKARAIGIHLIIATQRPDVKVITGGIKANFPARIAFRVMQMIDSRTIIDQPGANQLIGRGDMLFSKDGELTRIQCALVETKEVERIVDYIGRQQGYTSAYALPDYTPETGDSSGMGSEDSAPVKYDVRFAEIARDAVSGGNISTSMIQRNYEVGFNRAGRIMMQLERAGIVGRQQGAKPRDILYHDLPSLEAKLQELGVF